MATSKRKIVDDIIDVATRVVSDAPASTREQGYSRARNRAEFFGFNRGSDVFSFSDEGQIISRKLKWPDEPAAVYTERNQFAIPVKVNGGDALQLNEQGFPILPVGLIIISGGTGVGKSKFLKALARQMDIQRLLAVEPHDDGVEVGTLPTYSSVDGALAMAIMQSYNHPTSLYAIDSLRAPLFETTGAAGSKGVIMPFFTQITRVSNCLAMAGITVVATVNPMNNDPEYVVEFMSKLSASVPATILLESSSLVGGVESFSGTIQARPNRKKVPFTFTSGPRREIDHASLLSEISFEPVASNGLSFDEILMVNQIDKAL